MFEKISIGIKTFLRDEQLFNTIHAIQDNLSNAKMIIADCGDHTEEKDGVYADLAREGHHTIQLPFDAGFGAMSNAIADVLDRPYLLIGSDDFDFSTQDVRQGIKLLQEVLDDYPYVDIASGRVNNNPYEFELLDEGHTVTELPLDFIDKHRIQYLRYVKCDLTVNYSLIHEDVFDKVRWDDDVKIGQGEHGAFFVDCKRAGLVTVYVPGANINEQLVRNSARYNEYRNRARSPERACFVKRGIKKYVLGNGIIDYQEKQ
jgi:hypothetical protein